jgi:crotonobetainyl-CoA:carnitine CoA-transferase CaiB-like acyl-CoA transferase
MKGEAEGKARSPGASPAGAPQAGGLLNSLRLLDLTVGGMGFCTRLLADLGAQVIRIEKPGGGSPLPGFSLRETPAASLYHHAGKGSVTLDLQERRGRSLFLRLAARVDGVVEASLPGTLEALGLGYPELARINPGLILGSLTGFGQEGPRSRQPFCDLVAAATGGAMALCGRPERPPLAPSGAQPSYVTSLYGAVAVLMALRRRSLSGQGSHVDLLPRSVSPPPWTMGWCAIFPRGGRRPAAGGPALEPQLPSSSPAGTAGST